MSPSQEKAFEENFDFNHWVDADLVKSFISMCIREREEEIRKKVEGMIRELPLYINLEIDAIGASDAIRNQGYNQALSDILTFLQ